MAEQETKQCPFCGEEILAVAIKCKHCGSDIRKPIAKIDETYGNLMLAIPIVFILDIILSRITNKDFSKNIELEIEIIAYLTFFSHAILASVEANKLGIGSTSDLNKNGRRRKGPIAWFIFIYLLWPIGYPWYLYHRNKYGLKNRLGAGILISFIFFIILLIYYYLQNVN